MDFLRGQEGQLLEATFEIRRMIFDALVRPLNGDLVMCRLGLGTAFGPAQAPAFGRSVGA